MAKFSRFNFLPADQQAKIPIGQAELHAGFGSGEELGIRFSHFTLRYTVEHPVSSSLIRFHRIQHFSNVEFDEAADFVMRDSFNTLHRSPIYPIFINPKDFSHFFRVDQLGLGW